MWAPKPVDPTDHGRSGGTLLAQAAHDDLIERLAVPGVALPDEDSQQLAVPLDLHMTLPTAMPIPTAPMPATTEPATFKAPSPEGAVLAETQRLQSERGEGRVGPDECCQRPVVRVGQESLGQKREQQADEERPAHVHRHRPPRERALVIRLTQPSTW